MRGRRRSATDNLCWSDLTEQAKTAADPLKSEQLPSQVAAALDTSPRTVFRTKRRYAEEGLDGVLYDHPQANRYRKLDDRGEAHLIALACSDAPEDHDHWTLRLLADKVVELRLVVSLSHETVRLRLKKTPSSRSGTSSGASRK